METFRWEGLNRIKHSLASTNVISEDYARFIMGWAMQACSDAYNAGKEFEKSQSEA